MSETFPDQGPSERPAEWLETLSLLGDVARVRLLRLVEQAELGVGELAIAAQLPQSTVSRHLKALHEHGWIIKRVEGTASFYRLLPKALDADLRQLWETTRDRVIASPVFTDDANRLKQVLASRRGDSQAFFGRIGGEWHEMRRELFGTGFGPEAMLGLFDPDWVVADLGCGTGDVSQRLAPIVREVIAIDREPAMLDACRKRLGKADGIQFIEADLTALPLEDGSLDAAVIMLVLHHIAEPLKVMVETSRVLKPGGRALIVDMVGHERDDYRHDMGHQHLGFNEQMVRGWAAPAGFDRSTWRRLPSSPEGKGPGLFAAGFFKSGG